MTDRTSSRMGQRGRRLCFGFAGLAGLLAACGSPDGGDLFSNSGSGQAKPTGGDTGTAGSATAAGGSEVDGGEPGSGGSVSTGAVPADGGSSQGEAGTTIDSGGDTSTDAGAAAGGTSAGDGNAGDGNAGDGNAGATSTGGSSEGDAGQSNGAGTSGQAGEPGAAGQPAEEDCRAVWQEVQAALAEAQACSQRDGQSCAGFVEGMCCPVPVNDPDSDETKHYLQLLAHAQDACPTVFCPAVLCPENPRARCESSDGEARCASWLGGGFVD